MKSLRQWLVGKYLTIIQQYIKDAQTRANAISILQELDIKINT